MLVKGKLCLDDHCHTSHCMVLCDTLGEPNFAPLTRLLLKLVHDHGSNGSHAPTVQASSAVSVYRMEHVGGGMQVWSNNRASPPAATLTVVCGDPLLMSGLQDCLALATHKDDRLAQSAARLLCNHLLFLEPQ